MNQFIEAKKDELENAVSFFQKEIKTLRTGRANPSLLEGVLVEAYGTKSPLNAVANISVADGRSMVVAPWDKGIIKDVEKALVEADLGVGVVNEGNQIRLNIPPITEENRRELVKKLNEKMEKARITLRQVRDEIKESIEEGEASKEIAEDDKFRFLKELDEEIRKYNDRLKEIRDKKEEEIMTI
ncbi:ribosome recycling factor [Candidatus Parcubacteria bacterium]|nr:MAG: ribosome recycling factor [Candidatus Parcubacteria bacterium]